MEIPNINLHIHSTFSDGKNNIKQIIERAIKLHIDFICITDHFSNSWKASIIPTLNSKLKIDNYLDMISECQRYLSVKKVATTLLKGIEIDISSSQSYIINLVKPSQYDLILFEYLETPESISSIRNILDLWNSTISQKSKLPLIGLAHFDPSYFIYGNLETLIRFLTKYNIFFEFNSSYPQCYSRKNQVFFEKVKQNNIMVSIGCDSHSIMNLADYEEPREMIKYYELDFNLNKLIKFIKNRKTRDSKNQNFNT